MKFLYLSHFLFVDYVIIIGLGSQWVRQRNIKGNSIITMHMNGYGGPFPINQISYSLI